MKNLKLVTIKENKVPPTFRIGDISVGEDFLLIAGPCSIENEIQTLQTAKKVKAAGANVLRGGAFKPRTSPYSFQGLGLRGLKILDKARSLYGLPIITEVMDTRDVEIVADYADILQIGTRNMQNFSLLKEVGKTGKPVMLKRGMSSTLSEWLSSAEYIFAEGNPNIILCERGIRTFETYTRNTLDLSIVPSIKEITNLPVIVDPTHSTGRLSLVQSMSLASVAAGVDGLMIEVHYNPEEAMCDRDQAMPPEMFTSVAKEILEMRRFVLREREYDA